MQKKINIFLVLGLAFVLNACKLNYYSMDDFNSIKKIDAHVHLSYDTSSIVDLAKEDNFRLLFINTDVPDLPSLDTQFELASIQKMKYKDKTDFLTSFSVTNWDSTDWTGQAIEKLRKDFENGAIGVKIWKNIGMANKDSAGQLIMIDNPKFDKVIDFIIQQKKSVLGHLGEPKNCWLPLDKMTMRSDMEYFSKYPEYHMYLHPELPDYNTQIYARDRFLDCHPDLCFVGAHLGSLEWSVDELAKRLDKYPNMAVDMAERVCHLQFQSNLDREKVRDFIIKYQDRLIYGTDFIVDSTQNVAEAKEHWHATWLDDWKYFATDESMSVKQFDGVFSGLKLPKKVVDKIFHDNAVKWYKIED